MTRFGTSLSYIQVNEMMSDVNTGTTENPGMIKERHGLGDGYHWRGSDLRMSMVLRGVKRA